MKIRNIDTKEELTLGSITTIGNAIRLEFAGEDDALVEYVYPNTMLKFSLEDDGYELMEEER